jgi:hypothetical protein
MALLILVVLLVLFQARSQTPATTEERGLDGQTLNSPQALFERPTVGAIRSNTIFQNPAISPTLLGHRLR